MRREIDELFGDVVGRQLGPRRRHSFTPPVDVAYAADPPRAIVTVALAGVHGDDLELEVQGRELIISGHRRPDPAEGLSYEQVEIEHGPFRRVIKLVADVVPERTQALYEDGILRVELPLVTERERTRSVPIGIASRPRAAKGDEH